MGRLPFVANMCVASKQDYARERLKILLAGLPEAVQGLFKREIVVVEARNALPAAVLLGAPFRLGPLCACTLHATMHHQIRMPHPPPTSCVGSCTVAA